MNKAICAVGSGLGSTLMIGAGLGAAAGAIWLLVMGFGGLAESRAGEIIGTWIVVPLLCIATAVVLAAGWWTLSTWLYGHCREYWNKQ